MKKEKIIEIIILLLIFSLLITGVLVFNYYKNVKPNSYNIIFHDIDSIVKGSPVRFMGINSGHVVKLKRKNDYIICKIRITKKNLKIPDGTVAKVAFNGLGGSKSVELMPPLTNDPEAKGIVGTESLRISDFTTVIKDLRDVCIIINNFVQAIDTDLIMDNIKAIINPEIVDNINKDIDKAAERKEAIDSKKHLNFGALDDFIDNINKMFKKIF